LKERKAGEGEVKRKAWWLIAFKGGAMFREQRYPFSIADKLYLR